MVRGMLSPRAKAAILVLAVLLNVLGSPMAWARWLAPDSGANSGQSLGAAADHCAGHAAQDSPQDPVPLPCCASGDCQCAAPAMPAAMDCPTWTALRPTIAPCPAGIAVPEDLLDDALRPPIR
jgi:hypothetical protein